MEAHEVAVAECEGTDWRGKAEVLNVCGYPEGGGVFIAEGNEEEDGDGNGETYTMQNLGLASPS